MRFCLVWAFFLGFDKSGFFLLWIESRYSDSQEYFRVLELWSFVFTLRNDQLLPYDEIFQNKLILQLKESIMPRLMSMIDLSKRGK